jgi:hypothetical protein
MRALFLAFIFTLGFGQVAAADCAALTETAKILALELSAKRTLIKKFADQIKSGTGDVNQAQSNLEAAQNQHNALVSQIEDLGSQIKDGCPLAQ